MANFIEYASKAQEQLNIEMQKVSEKEALVTKKASANAKRSAELDERESALTLKEQEINAKREELTAWESKKVREEQVQAMYDEANAKDVSSTKKLKDASDALILADQKLEELLKRELALSEKRKTYEEEVRQEIMARFLGVK